MQQTETSRAAGDHVMSPRGSARTHVLVVDDEQDIAGLIKHTLEKGGEIEVELVATGDAALKAVTEALASDGPPDAMVEIRQQNQQILVQMDQLKLCQEELEGFN